MLRTSCLVLTLITAGQLIISCCGGADSIDRYYYATGEIMEPGRYFLGSNTTLHDVVFRAGGVSDFCYDRVEVRHSDGTSSRYWIFLHPDDELIAFSLSRDQFRHVNPKIKNEDVIHFVAGDLVIQRYDWQKWTREESVKQGKEPARVRGSEKLHWVRP